MTERPILFSAPMVRSILARTKKQTRRVVKGAPDDWAPMQPQAFWPTVMRHGIEEPGAESYGAGNEEGDCWVTCPYGQPGDRLWVREAWRAPLAYELTPPRDIPPGTPVVYQADGHGSLPHFNAGKLRPSMFMPRWASRITLEITGVRVERLQAISKADAIAEGIERGDGFPGWYRAALNGDSPELQELGRAFKIPTAFPELAYRALWESINGPDSWAANPWVWIVEFARAA